MIYCIYLNPTIDKTIYLKALNVGGTNRPEKILTDGAGKAINVAVVLKELNKEVSVLGFLYDSDKQIIKDRLKDKNIPCDFCEVEGTSRTNTKIFADGVITEINESGMLVSQVFIDRICGSIVQKINKGDIAVLTGSLPPGCAKDTYGKLIEKLNAKGVKCILDADDSVLKFGIEKKPYFIKPNIDELKTITQVKSNSIADVISAVKTIIDDGVSVVGISMGGDGALIIDKNKAYFAKPLKLNIKSTVGAGDSMVAGIVANIDTDIKEALRAGVAAASASVTLEGTQLCTAELFKEYYAKIEIEEVN